MKTLLALSFFLLEISPVQAQTPYFQGKTIRTSPVIPPAISTICGRDSSPSTTESFFARELFNLAQEQLRKEHRAIRRR
jgi:hypothetical protein